MISPYTLIGACILIFSSITLVAGEVEWKEAENLIYSQQASKVPPERTLQLLRILEAHYAATADDTNLSATRDLIDLSAAKESKCNENTFYAYLRMVIKFKATNLAPYIKAHRTQQWLTCKDKLANQLKDEVESVFSAEVREDTELLTEACLQSTAYESAKEKLVPFGIVGDSTLTEGVLTFMEQKLGAYDEKSKPSKEQIERDFKRTVGSLCHEVQMDRAPSTKVYNLFFQSPSERPASDFMDQSTFEWLMSFTICKELNTRLESRDLVNKISSTLSSRDTRSRGKKLLSKLKNKKFS